MVWLILDELAKLYLKDGVNMNFKNIKLSKQDKWLLLLFVICATALAWMAGDLIIYSRTYNSYYNTLHLSDTECLANGKTFKTRNDGICYSEDAY